MKKLYTLLAFVAVSASVNAQTPIITGIMDGDCTGGNPKVLEIYASGTVNFANYSLENQTNASTTWGNTYSLASFGTRTNSFIYIVNGTAAEGTVFSTEFPAIPSTDIAVVATPTVMNVNGDDRVRIVDASANVIDQYGAEGTDGSGTAWEYTDSWAKKNNGVSATGAAFNTANWTFGGGDYSGATPNGSLNNLGTCQGAAAFSTVVPFGQFTLASQEFAIAGLKVFPNPVKNGNLYISSDSNVSKSVAVYDVLGKQVVNTTVSNQPINVSSLNAGVYIVKITEAGKTATRKLVIE